jgi:hypothetical protein
VLADDDPLIAPLAAVPLALALVRLRAPLSAATLVPVPLLVGSSGQQPAGSQPSEQFILASRYGDNDLKSSSSIKHCLLEFV